MNESIRSTVQRGLGAGIACFVFALQALGNTWIVDQANGPGTNFIDIPQAISAAAAGDVILVRPGSYSSFTLGRGLSVLGQGAVLVNGNILVSGVPANEVAIVSRLQPPANSYQMVKVSACAGSVLLQDLDSLLDVQSSADVRVFRVTSGPQVMGQIEALSVRDSRVQIAQSNLRGGFGTPEWYPQCLGGEPGGNGISAWGASRVHLAISTSAGGAGSCTNINCGLQTCFGGGSGVFGNGYGVGGLQLILAGGGGIGLAAGGVGSSYDGYSMALTGTSNALSSSMTYTPAAPAIFTGSTLTYSPTLEPTLEMIGSPQAGGTITLRLRAEPGTVARLNLGAKPIVQPQPGVLVEGLVLKQRSFDRGVVPPSGIIDSPWPFALTAPHGKLLIFQAKVTDPLSGLAQKSNSIEAVIP